MADLDAVRAELGAIIGVAAFLARQGDYLNAQTLKGAADSIRRTLCDHHGEAIKHLSMAGTSLRCRTCGAER